MEGFKPGKRVMDDANMLTSRLSEIGLHWQKYDLEASILSGTVFSDSQCICLSQGQAVSMRMTCRPENITSSGSLL